MSTSSREATASYITDMLALEKHIFIALAGQIEDLNEEAPQIVAELRSVQLTCEGHIERLESLASDRNGAGQGLAGVVKKAASSMLGVGAAVVDFVRGETLPKNLRDDYTALSLASIGYVMLYTAALSLGDDEVGATAHEHLQNHARSLIAVYDLVPLSVVSFLKDEGHNVQDRMTEISRNISAVRETENSVPQPD